MNLLSYSADISYAYIILKCVVAIMSKNVHSLDKKYFIAKKKC